MNKVNLKEPTRFFEIVLSIFFLLFFIAVSMLTLAFPYYLISNIINYTTLEPVLVFSFATLVGSPICFWLGYKTLKMLHVVENVEDQRIANKIKKEQKENQKVKPRKKIKVIKKREKKKEI